MSFWDLFKTTIGIDPGSDSLRIVHGDQIIFNEPARISFDKKTNKMSGIGGSSVVSDGQLLLKPMYYSIWDFHAFEMLLRGAIMKGLNMKGRLPKTFKMYFAIPNGSNEIEKRAYRDSAEHANAAEVVMIHQSVCAAISLNILFERRNFILIDFSATKVEISVFIDSRIYSSGNVRMGTWKIHELVVNYVRRRYQVEVNEAQVAQALLGIESLNDSKDAQVAIADHQLLVVELKAILRSYFQIVNDMLLTAVEMMTRHPYYQRVLANGIFFTGGGAVVNCLREQLLPDLDMSQTVSRTPFLDNINGLQIAIRDYEKYKHYLMF